MRIVGVYLIHQRKKEREMNLITVIQVIAILFGLTDFLTERYPRLQRDIYYISLFTITFLFTIKYYYGADIWNYVHFYNELSPSPKYVWYHSDSIPQNFELGYALLCSAMKSAGISFYWMTAIISLFYFAVIALLFRQIPRKRSFALAILVVLDFNCIFATYRQCLAVSCFILFILCFRDKKYFIGVLMALLTVLFHKSGLFVVSLTGLLMLVPSRRNTTSLYQLLLLVLVLTLILPIAQISSTFIQHLPLPLSYLHSIQHHLSLGRQIQTVFIVYAVTLFVIAYFTQYNRTRLQAITFSVIAGLILVAFMYQYYYLLVRLRSYFLPLVITYGFSLVQESENRGQRVPYGALVKQAASFLLLLYMTYATYAFNRDTKQMKSNIYIASTVFDLIDHRPSDVQKTQMNKALKYWREDFMKDTHNKVN